VLLLGLVMIIRDEAHGIAETLQSFRPYIDSWTILDTGSTDGTQDIVRRTLASVPGRLVEEPFVDFSTSRNQALDLHDEQTTFTIMPDSDDRLENGAALRRFVIDHTWAKGAAHEAYQINLRRNRISYYLPLLLRTADRWRYRGRVHECCGRPGAPLAPIRVPDVAVTQTPKQKSLEASKARWKRDLELLQADHAQNPKNPRTLFYLAQTYECLDRRTEALEAYNARIGLDTGLVEETFEAMLRRARLMATLPQLAVSEAILEAHELAPERAEPLCVLADYLKRDAPGFAFEYAKRAMQLEQPKDALLFVDYDAYRWKAANLVAITAASLGPEERYIGKLAAEKAVAGYDKDDDLTRASRVPYLESSAELYGARHWQIPYQPAAPFVAANPSVHFDDGVWRCVIRLLNYRIVNGVSYESPNKITRTRNMMAELGGNPAQGFQIENLIEMVDRDGTERTHYPCHGFEDCRLFRIGPKLYCTATACDFPSDNFGQREIVLCELDKDYSIARAIPLRGPWSVFQQKNWMPMAIGNTSSSTKIVYSLKPRIVIELSTMLDGSYVLGASDQPPPPANRHLRGGSQLVKFDAGYLCLIHDVIFSGPKRLYLHRFVWLDEALTVRKMSELFYFEKKGIEYAAGLAYDGRHLVASYSVDDSNANLAIFDAGRVRYALREDYVV
jgi:hypothetical protein